MDRKTAKIAKRFVSKIKKAYDAEKVILFGSRARGDNFKRSDFDFMIISRKFKGIPYIKRLPGIYDYWDNDEDIEFMCYTPDEFSKRVKSSRMIRKAVEEGVEV